MPGSTCLHSAGAIALLAAAYYGGEIKEMVWQLDLPCSRQGLAGQNPRTGLKPLVETASTKEITWKAGSGRNWRPKEFILLKTWC